MEWVTDQSSPPVPPPPPLRTWWGLLVLDTWGGVPFLTWAEAHMESYPQGGRIIHYSEHGCSNSASPLSPLGEEVREGDGAGNRGKPKKFPKIF